MRVQKQEERKGEKGRKKRRRCRTYRMHPNNMYKRAQSDSLEKKKIKIKCAIEFFHLKFVFERVEFKNLSSILEYSSIMYIFSITYNT
jgi:hypothetical protein